MVSGSLARRRAQEDGLRAREEYLKDNFKVEFNAQWETKTTEKIKKREIIERVRESEETKQKRTEERKNAVSTMLHNEMEDWKGKLAFSRIVTPEERMIQIREKAVRLKEAREENRQNFVNECYDKQWRDDCDEIRAMDSLEITAKLMRDRRQALIYREAKLKDSDENDRYNEERKQHFKILDEKEMAVQEASKQKNLEIKLALDEQVRANQVKQIKVSRQRKFEEEDLLERWENEEEDERKSKEKLLEESRERGRKMLELNTARYQQRIEVKARERENDLVLLKYALKKESDSTDCNKSKKENEKKLSREYEAFLKDQMQKEKDENLKVDDIRATEMEKIWVKRDEALQAQADARGNLLKEVQKGRQEQMRIKILVEEEEKEASAEQARFVAQKLKVEEENERDENSRNKVKTVERMRANKYLADHNRQQEQAKESEKYHLRKKMQEAETKRQMRLDQLKCNPVAYYPLKNTNWYT
mmetsp:Transcript_39775/g.47796  ORF Transcript_39775/g.47796 Transcript_39775/m.47796 type:complete len:477 (-) Transcript_39775:389-1819(-)